MKFEVENIVKYQLKVTNASSGYKVGPIIELFICVKNS